MILLMVLGWNDVCTPLIQIWPLLLLVTDAAASSVFSMMMAHGFELHQASADTLGSVSMSAVSNCPYIPSALPYIPFLDICANLCDPIACTAVLVIFVFRVRTRV